MAHHAHREIAYYPTDYNDFVRKQTNYDDEPGEWLGTSGRLGAVASTFASSPLVLLSSGS